MIRKGVPLFAEISDAVILTILAGVIGGFGYLFKELLTAWKQIAHRERELLDMESRKKNFEALSVDAVEVASDTVDRSLATKGIPPVVILADVVSDSQSPSTPEQREQAKLQTLKARLEALKLAEGLPPRKTPPHAAPGMHSVPAEGKRSEPSQPIGKVAEKTLTEIADNTKKTAENTERTEEKIDDIKAAADGKNNKNG